MNRMRHIFFVAMLLTALSAVSCTLVRLYDEYEEPQLMVSLYIPGATMTRAETGMVNPLEEEKKITSLQIWAFLSEDGTLISYKSFGDGLEDTGLSNATITRFGLPLSEEMFALLTSENRPKVDVYAVANVASAVAEENMPTGNSTRTKLDYMILTEMGGNSPLTRAVPQAGLPMSGVLKNADVNGGYPVLNINTIKLTRAVSKIRFVFGQQGIPASGDTPAAPANGDCKIIGIQFDGTTAGKDCQIATTERLFTTQSFDLGLEPGYTALSASIRGTSGNPLIPNNKLSVVEDPEALFFRGAGNEVETAEHYEARLDAAIDPDSQIGPIYLRETDKTISGTITYRVAADGPDLTAHFSMETGDVFSRNHTWIVYACFMEETMQLRLKVVVLDWDWESFVFDFTSGAVNVVRRFTVFETTPSTFDKDEADGFYDVRFWHTVAGVEGDNVVKGDIVISSPVGATLHIIPVPQPGTQTPDAILVSPSSATIYPNYTNMENGKMEDCIIGIEIRANKNYTDAQLEGQYIDLHFSVETLDGRFIDLGSESIDYYRFILDPDWMPTES